MLPIHMVNLGMKLTLVSIALAGSLLLVAARPNQISAAPSTEELQKHSVELREKLDGQGYTILLEPPFIIIGDESPARVAQRAKFVKWVITLLEKDYFTKRPDKIIDIWLFKNITTYKRGAKKFFDDEPTTPFGYFSPSASALIMNIGPGPGTLSHELVHPYFAANFSQGPTWFNEGLASLYEQPSEKNGHMWGKTNWRLPGLQKMIRGKTLPTLAQLMATSTTEFYDAEFDAYAYARFVCQYLQDHGKLIEFYKTWNDTGADKDPTGSATMEVVVGMKLTEFENVFKTWALALRR
jgi:hypothetical protein